MKGYTTRSRNTNNLWQQCNTEPNVIKPLFFGHLNLQRENNQRDLSNYHHNERESYANITHEARENQDYRQTLMTNYQNNTRYSDNDQTRFYKDMKSNFIKYQDSVAKDEYCRVGQSKGSPSAIYDSMQFLCMKREKSMNLYNNDDSNSHVVIDNNHEQSFHPNKDENRCYTEINDQVQQQSNFRLRRTGDLNISTSHIPHNDILDTVTKCHSSLTHFQFKQKLEENLQNSNDQISHKRNHLNQKTYNNQFNHSNQYHTGR